MGAIGVAAQQTAVLETTGLLVLGGPFGAFVQGDGYAMAADANDNFYIANSDGSVNIYNPETKTFKAFVTFMSSLPTTSGLFENLYGTAVEGGTGQFGVAFEINHP